MRRRLAAGYAEPGAGQSAVRGRFFPLGLHFRLRPQARGDYVPAPISAVGWRPGVPFPRPRAPPFARTEGVGLRNKIAIIH